MDQAAATPPPPAVTARGLGKRYGDLVAVAGIDFTIYHGQCFGFLGPNGAGKTTAMKMIYGRLPVGVGDLHVLGFDVRRQSRAVKSRIGVVPQEDNLDPDFTVWDNLLVYARYFGISGVTARRRARELLEFVQLTEKTDVLVDKLSGGQKRRLVIARALMNEPDLVVLDEPTTGLDPQARHLVWAKLRELKQRGITLLLTTHYMEEAAQLCDYLVIMDRGRILTEGSPEDLVRRHVGSIAVELRLAPAQHAAALELIGAGLRGHDVAGETLVVFVDNEAAVNTVVEQLRRVDLALAGYFWRPASLEDVFLRLAGRTLAEGGVG